MKPFKAYSSISEGKAKPIIPYTVPSGAWAQSNSDNEGPILTNPKLFCPPDYYLSELPESTSVKADVITDADFSEYAVQLIIASGYIKSAAPDVVLVPLRGGLRLWQHLHVLCGLQYSDGITFPFSGEEKHSEQPKAIISESMSRCEGSTHVSIVCVDAADGGQGSTRVIDIMESIYDGNTQTSFTLNLCLFVAVDNAYPEWKYKHTKRSKSGFTVNVQLFAVPNIIGEDLASAMICEANTDSHGQFITTGNKKDLLVESSNVPGVIDRKITEAIHDELRTGGSWSLKHVCGESNAGG